jgi:hypothetical protein
VKNISEPFSVPVRTRRSEILKRENVVMEKLTAGGMRRLFMRAPSLSQRNASSMRAADTARTGALLRRSRFMARRRNCCTIRDDVLHFVQGKNVRWVAGRELHHAFREDLERRVIVEWMPSDGVKERAIREPVFLVHCHSKAAW